MFLHQMRDSERASFDRIERRLEEAGWDLEPVRSLIRDGTSMDPQISGGMSRGEVQLTADIYIGDCMVVFTLRHRKNTLILNMKSKYNFGKIIDWIIASQNLIDFDSFADHVKKLIPLCDSVMFVAEDGRQYELSVDQL